MSEPQLGDKETIDILALEYNSLRGHINARMSSMFQLAAVFVASAALLFRQSIETPVLVTEGIVLVAFGIGLWLLWHDMVKAGRRVQQLETEINRRANEKLLIWESELGGISHGYWR
ncbi:MAG TPA: hypothetical protein VNN25_23765 [Thermoanaerobaculia bacterium]|nr:hypothetical protein [Thermoanaerobaculia bacterium]